jgi:hypothetical protein
MYIYELTFIFLVASIKLEQLDGSPGKKKSLLLLLLLTLSLTLLLLLLWHVSV